MVIRLRKRSDCEKIILAILMVTFIEGTLSAFIPQIHPIFYFTDVLNFLLLCTMISKKSSRYMYNSNLRYFFFFFVLFCIFAAISIITNFSNLVLHLWGIRRIYTNFIFFFACVFFGYSNNIKFIDRLLVWNIIMCIIEVLLGYRQDYVGGIYGTSGGDVNGPLNLLLIIIVTKSIIQYINKKEKFQRVLLVLASSVGIAAFAELKAFFVECIVLIVLCSLVTKFSYKKLFLYIVSAIGAIVGIKLLFMIFPDISENMFSAAGIWRYLTNPGGYVGQFAGNAGDMNRLAFWDKSMALLPNAFDKLFGLGIGNCEYIDVLNLKSSFYISHWRLHYYMFPLVWVLLQQGIIGMVLYILLFVALFFAIRKQKDSRKFNDITLYQVAEVLCLMAFVITIYDTSLMGKGGFLFFFVLSLPFNRAREKE